MVNLRWSVCNDKKKFAEILLKRIFANYRLWGVVQIRGQREHVSAYLLSTGMYSRKSATQR